MYSVLVDSGTRATPGEYSGLGVNSPEPWSEEPVLNAESPPKSVSLWSPGSEMVPFLYTRYTLRCGRRAPSHQPLRCSEPWVVHRP